MVRFLRGLATVLIFVAFGIGSLILAFIYIPIVSIWIKKSQKRHHLVNIIHYLWNIYTGFFVNLKLIKIDVTNFYEPKGKIIVATHPSFIDILILIGLFPNCLCLAKQKLMNNFFMGKIIKDVYITNDIDVESFKAEAEKALKDGFNIIIFPTGTRTVEGEKLKIHKGAAMLQIETGADIIPIKISCDYPFLQKGKPIYDASDRTITYKIDVLPEIKLSDFGEITSDIKLRKAISEKIKFDFTN